MKKKSTIIALSVLVLLGIGGTFAYYSSSTDFDNVFETATYKTVANEVFTSPTNWKPGDETPKTITVKNEGDIGAYVRVCLSDSWLAADGTTRLSNYDATNNINIAIVNSDNTDDWTYNYSSKCYYYNAELASGEETNSPIKSVTFNSEYQGDVVCTKDATGKTVTCESATNGYDGARYTLTLTAETIQKEGLSEWGAEIGYFVDPTNVFSSASELNSASGFNVFIKRNKIGAPVNQIGLINGTDEHIFDQTSDEARYQNNKNKLITIFGNSACMENISGSGTDMMCETDKFTVHLLSDGMIDITDYETHGVMMCYGGIECRQLFTSGYSATGNERVETSDMAVSSYGHNNYLRYQVVGKKTITSVGIKNSTNEYYLIGGDGGTSYSDNKVVLNNIFGSGSCTETTGGIHNNEYRCENSTMTASVYGDGYVTVVENGAHEPWLCEINNEGESGCNTP